MVVVVVVVVVALFGGQLHDSTSYLAVAALNLPLLNKKIKGFKRDKSDKFLAVRI